MFYISVDLIVYRQLVDDFIYLFKLHNGSLLKALDIAASAVYENIKGFSRIKSVCTDISTIPSTYPSRNVNALIYHGHSGSAFQALC